MQNLKINRIEIYNFKKFTHKSFDFRNSDITVLDGPNGFGKTTLYDAIELLLTGKIRRYENLSIEALDKRNSDNGNPLVNDSTKDSLYIKGELQINEHIHYIMRKAPMSSLINDNSISFDYYDLYRLSSFEDQEGERKTDLSEWLGGYYERNFEFLHYIEQEDNIRLLKNKGKDRRDKISYLFNTEKYTNELKKISVISSKLKKRINLYETNEITWLKTEINQKSSSIAASIEITDYIRIFPNINVEWDAEEFKISNEFYDSFFSTDGEYELIKRFSHFRDEYKKFCISRIINKLKNNDSDLITFLDYFPHIGKLSELQIKRKAIANANRSRDLISDINIDFFNRSESDIETLNRYLGDIKSSFALSFKDIKSVIKTATSLNKSISDFLLLRDNLITQYQKISENDSKCPICGYDWNEKVSLIRSIEEKTADLRDIYKNQLSTLNDRILRFKDSFITVITKNVQLDIDANQYDERLLSKLEQISRSDMSKIEQHLQFIGVDFKDICMKEGNLALLHRRLELVNSGYDEEKIDSQYDRVFSDYCTEDWMKVATFPSVELLNNKSKYLKWLRDTQLSKDIIKLKEKLVEKEARVVALRDHLQKIETIENQYIEALNEYNSTIIDNIEILFHIYSGRILQTSPSCLGLFIQNDPKRIKFLNNFQDKCDVVFTMSSGQLSALIIAFTMSLNKIYSKNKLLFIDDPVQTMDDINILSFIELLRNDFIDNQIFISTHEKRMSDLIRYKFAAFSAKHKAITMKEM